MLQRSGVMFVVGLLLLCHSISAEDGQDSGVLNILGIVPAAHANHVALDANIQITFDQGIDGATLSSATVVVRGRQSGILGGVFSGGGSTVITFNPDNNFRLGERISVTITTGLQGSGGMNLLRGHTYSFTAVSGAAPSSPASFAQRHTSGVFSGEDIKAMDFDGDGDLDIVAAYEGVPEQIVFFENDGAMGFCGITTGGNYRNVEVYDIDGDGDYDTFGATGSFDTELNWFENEGSMPFTERFISSEDPWTLAGGDIDSDGDIDVLAAVILPNRVLWFRNDGAGNFSSPFTIPTTFSGGSNSFFYIRDINSDGAMDILAFHFDAYNLVWYENDGNLDFTEHLIANTTDRLRLAEADIDGDGDIDIVGVSKENGPTTSLFWFENDGNENFSQHTITVSTTGRLQAVSIADVDGDLDMDILGGGYWFDNDGSQNFSERPISDGLRLGTNYFTNGLDHADLDGDGDMDVLTVGLYAIAWQENSSFLGVTASTPANAASDVSRISTISISFDQAIDNATVNSSNIWVKSQYSGEVSGNFSGGGTNTIVFTPDDGFRFGDIIEVSVNENLQSMSGQRLQITHGFSFQVQTSAVSQAGFTPHSLLIHGNNATGLAVADVDGDGDQDLLSCSFTELFWHENDGSGNFTSIPVVTSSTAAIGVFAFDQDNDGDMDILVDVDGSASSNLYVNDGNQNFSEIIFFGSSTIKQLTDVNYDGDEDIVYLSNINTYVGWSDKKCDNYIGFGWIADLASRGVQAADMDNDGDMDFVTSSTIGATYYQNEGYFIYSNSTIDDNSTIDQYLADLDGDGDLDAVFVENFSAIIWYENRLTEPTADFGDRQEIGVLNMDPRDVVASDLDGDGDADIAAVSRNDDKVVWYENRLNEGSADFGPVQLLAGVADGPVRILSADLDGNGSMDLITLSDLDEELIWWENTGTVTAIEEHEPVVPLEYALLQNYPNPFNPTTVIRYSLIVPRHVQLDIFDVSGRLVKTAINDQRSTGRHEYVWDGTNDAGEQVAGGLYLYRLRAGEFTQTRKMILMR